MFFICNYLKVIIEYLKGNLCQGMNLSELNHIKTVDRSKLPRNVDARSEDDTIFLSVQSIRQAMESVHSCDKIHGKDYLIY